ncbi:hypothetical protein HII17_10930 [Thalassotalea sp. M1531]|uniref:Uncharacterized protein n=1 Tax=Thalassotalea algicola TaxID=2716224 RepID=A0A7Y0LCL6_9GAMM|nr:hypothetical protein [Thalassotalea algicola]NMP32083.1 hypothetical protein [Thalassotalea algicola]
MKQGTAIAIIASVFVHLALFGLVSLTIEKPIHIEKPPETISSYLYTPTTPPPIEQEAPIKEVPVQQAVEVIKSKVSTSDVEEVTERVKEVVSNPPNKASTHTPKPEVNKQILTSTQGEASIKAEAFKQLDRLRESISNQVIEDSVNQFQQHRSVSAMHPNPLPAPKSVVPLTRAQKKEKNTVRYSDDLSIIKGEDGRCGIEEDLSKVGIEGVKAYSSFNCGESKFDKSFRLHMKKVAKKLGKR